MTYPTISPAWLEGATAWLNSPPLTPADLHDRVVAVGFWTYTCINWLRTAPYLRAWNTTYADRGLAIVSVHTPEFDFEHDLGNVRRAAEDIQIGHPIAADNHRDIWDAFGNHYWPSLYLLDARGRTRYRHFGEGEYDRSETTIRRLLTEAGAGDLGPAVARVDAAGVEAAADWDNLWSPENYLGSERAENFASPNGAVLGTRHAYTAPARLRLNQWALSGEWAVAREAAVLHRAGGTITCRFRARDLHLVLAPIGEAVRFRVCLDGQPPAAAHGIDVDERGNGTITQPRLHQLIRQPGPVAELTFEITFLDPGIGAYAFTFG
jgi:thiol-disulfide isomerase/thioredoxin